VAMIEAARVVELRRDGGVRDRDGLSAHAAVTAAAGDACEGQQHHPSPRGFRLALIAGFVPDSRHRSGILRFRSLSCRDLGDCLGREIVHHGRYQVIEVPAR